MESNEDKALVLRDFLRRGLRGGRVRTVARRYLPPAVARTIKRFLNGGNGEPVLEDGLYGDLYEKYVETFPRDEVVGDGDFDLIGRIQLALAVHEGLRPHHTLVDLGCGTGRLAVHAVPFLTSGAYIGTDASRGMLSEARRRVAELPSGARVRWHLQRGEEIDAGKESVDRIVAFSVFTHIEHEDAFRYLESGLRVVKPGGKFLFSCLPLDLEISREILRREADLTFGERWRRARNVVTSQDFMTELARLAGWTVSKWYRGDEPNIRLLDSNERRALGQSVCVLMKPVAP